MKRSTINLVGVLLLVFGVGSAELIYWLGRSAETRSGGDQSGEVTDRQDSTLPAEALKGANRGLEMDFGKPFALLIGWEQWWDEQPSYERVAITVAAIAVLLAGGCFLLANWGKSG
jgi:hypothetical protein